MQLDMEYINAHFASIKDLERLDGKISELESFRLSINDAASSKLTKGPDSRSHDSTEQEVEKNKKIEEILSKVREVFTKREDEALMDVSRLMKEHGKLGVLEDIQRMYLKKTELKKGIEFLQKAVDVENETTGLGIDDVSKFWGINEKIQALAQEETAISSQTLVKLTGLLDSKVEEFRVQLEEQLVNVLESIKWLSPKDSPAAIPPPKLASVQSYMTKLLQLQDVNNTPEYPDTWWAMDILLNPIVVRFNYHFNAANKETNKLSKPEWAFNFVESFLSENMPYLKLIIGDSADGICKIIDYAAISSLLKPVRQKMFKMIEIINGNISKFQDNPEDLEKSGRILSHLIFELSAFDQRLRNVYKFNPYIQDLSITPSRKWMGLTGDILLVGNGENLAATNWLNFEFELATKRFNSEIIESDKAFQIDFDFQASHVPKNVNDKILKPTYSAYNLIKLFDNLTSHHKTLSIVKYQLKYVSNIQLKLVDLYSDNLYHLLSKFSDSFNLKLVLNFIPGGLSTETNKDTDTIKNVLKGLQILTELYCLTKFVNDNLEQWSEGLIFIQLWNSYKTISNKTHAPDLTIFDNSISDYQELITKILSNYEQLFRKEIKTALKNYVNSSQWDINSSGYIEPSSDLSILVNNLPIYMGYLEKCLSGLDYYLISNKVVTLLSVVLREFIITNNQFSATGVKQMRVDFDFIVNKLKHELLLSLTFAEYSNINNRDYRKVHESIELLEKLDSETSTAFKRNFDKIPSLRSMFDSGLNHLSDHEINDIILRIL